MTSETINFTMDVNINVEDVIRIARDAGQLLLERYNSTEQCMKRLAVSEGDQLVLSDRCARGLVCMELTQLNPHVPIVSEDNHLVPYSVRRLYQHYWMIAPLDGGRAFTERTAQFTVNIALVKGRTPVLGVVYTPCEDITHWAVRGRGAFVRVGVNGPDEPIKCAEYNDCDLNLTVVATSSDSGLDMVSFVGNYREPNITTVSSSIKFMMIADGRAHLYPRFSATKEWDTCASQVIVEEAGGEVLKLPELSPLEYGKEDTNNPHFVSYAKRVPPGASDNLDFGFAASDANFDEVNDLFAQFNGAHDNGIRGMAL